MALLVLDTEKTKSCWFACEKLVQASVMTILDNFLLSMRHDSSPCKHRKSCHHHSNFDSTNNLQEWWSSPRPRALVVSDLCRKLLEMLFSCDAEDLFLVTSRKKSLAHFCMPLVYYQIENVVTITIGSVWTSEQGMKDATFSQEISEPSDNSWSTK